MQYAKDHLKRIPLDVPKTSYDEIKAHAAMQGETVNGFIKRAITETMQRDQAQPIQASAQQPSQNADTPILQSTSETESKPDPHTIAREMLDQQIEDNLLIEQFPDWYIHETAENPQKRELLLAYAVEHEDENSCCRQIVKRFRGIM